MRPCSARVTVRGTALLIGMLLFSASAAGESAAVRTHVVHEGQRLGSIAKRYQVTVEALSAANGLKNHLIRPGQKLVIPARDDPDGSRARAQNEGATNSGGVRRRSATEPAQAAALPAARTHRVESGQRLELIARRYGASVEAICDANGIQPTSRIKPGLVLYIPDVSGKSAPFRLQTPASGRPAYFKAPKRKGYLQIYGYNLRWQGHVFDKKGRLLPAAGAGVARVLGTGGKHPKLDDRLLRLLVKVSDSFGGRPIRIVSGYRTASFVQDSRHKLSRALDFSIPGVPNEVLRDYLRSFPNTGVGYYPNSSFVHLDVRPYSAYWVDYAGPGQAPRRNNRVASAARARSSELEHHEEHGAVAQRREAPPAPLTEHAGSLPAVTDTESDSNPALALPRATLSPRATERLEVGSDPSLHP